MKIGIDARFYGVAGPGRYISCLISELEKKDKTNEYVIFVTKEGSKKYHPQNANFKKWISDYPWYSVQEQTSFLIDLMRARLDLLHVPHFNIPILYPKKFVVTIHDLIMHEADSQTATTKSPMLFTFKKLVYRFVLNWAAMKSKKIIVPSETVKKEILENIKAVKDQKIVVTYEGVGENLLKLAPSDKHVISTQLEEKGIREQYFLYVGSSYPHKNLNTLVVSFKDLLNDNPSIKVQLVIAGKVDDFSQRLAGFVHALKLDHKIIFAAKYAENNYVSDKDVAYLYKGALAYVFPSLKEGFSITPLEAQSFGVPVLLSDIPTHKEVFGESVEYFQPKSTVELTKKMQVIVKDKELREDLIKRGNENIKKYSWSEMADKTLEIYNNTLSNSKTSNLSYEEVSK